MRHIGAWCSSVRLLEKTAVIQSPTETRDAYGAVIPGWQELATVRATVEAIGGQERRADGAQVSAHSHRLMLRWRSDITTACRVLVDGKTLLIRAVMEVGRRRMLRVMCDEIA